MNERQLRDAFKTYTFQKWKTILDFVFGKVEYFSSPNNPFAEDKKVISGKQYGLIKLDDGKSLALFEVEVDNSINIERNRQGLREIAARHIDQNITHGALVFFYSPLQDNYRFTFIAKWSELDFETGELQKGETQKKRYTYLLGENESGATAAKRFLELANKKPVITIQNVINAFSVEPIKKEFFKKYKEHYERFWRYIDERTDYQVLLIDTEKENEDDKRKPIRDFSKKLLGRIVFLHFLQKKGWMGCPVLSTKKENDEIWENGDPNFMFALYDDFTDKDHFYSKCLTELFFSTLNEPDRENNVFSITGNRVPYLNGGLFENDQPNTDDIDFPASYFQELLDFFCQYNFTIDENSPDEQEIGIDPEMLGHIFENLLEENREKGAFYTPKEIVHYMCQESLVQYLKNHLPEEVNVEAFIRNQHVSDYLRNRENATRLNDLLDKVKVCDPAIGSGAFPIGILQEIYLAKRYIYPYLNNIEAFDPAESKKKIIQESIYGVDMEYGAVEIARLRFWLALVVDEDKPEPLPNLDYKIMQGNSLLESYEGIDLSNVASLDEPRIAIINPTLFAEPESTYNISEEDKRNIKELISSYFDIEDKEEKIRIHKRIDKLVLDHIDKSLEFFENRLLIEIADLEKKLERKTESLNQEQKQKLVAKSKELKEIEKKRRQLNSKAQAREKLLQFENTQERPYFLWHLFFKDVFDNGGFDIVIGNPPYIQLQKMIKEADILEEAKFETFTRMGDIYCVFYEKGFNVLKSKGVLTFITSNKWMKGGYGKVLRKYFLKVNTLKIINLGPGIFQSATVDTHIFVGKNDRFINDVRGLTVDNKTVLSKLSDNDFIPLKNLSEDAWVVLDQEETELYKYFQKNGKALNQWQIKINFGIKTGYNEALLLDQRQRDLLVDEDPSSDEIIKPILKGKEIQRYFAQWKGNYVISTFPSLNVEIGKYKAVKEYLERFLPKLKQTGEIFINSNGEKEITRKKTGNKWFETQDQIDFVEEFRKEKVIWKRIGSIMRFAYSDEEMYCLDSTCIATGEKIKYLTAVLNSKAGLYQLFKTSPQTGTGDQIISVQALEPLLVHYPSQEIEDKFNLLVDIILFIKKSHQPLLQSTANDVVSSTFEDVVDQMVFELYFREHMQDLEIDVSQFFDFPDINKLDSPNEKKQEVLKSWYKLQEKDNPIRNRILVSDSRSWIVKKINQTVL